MDRFKLSVASVGLMTLAFLPAQVQAQTGGGVAIELPDIRNYVGIAVGVVPDYPGSNDYTAGIAPTALFHFSRNSEYYVRLLVSQLSLNLIDNKNINAGPTVMYRFGRDDDVDDRAVKRMKEIDGGFEAEEFDDARTYLLRREPFRRETPQQWADLLAQSALYRLPFDDPEWVKDGYRRLERDGVEAALRRHLHPESLKVTIGEPRRDAAPPRGEDDSAPSSDGGAGVC